MKIDALEKPYFTCKVYMDSYDNPRGFVLTMYLENRSIGKYASYLDLENENMPVQDIELDSSERGKGLGKLLALVGIYQDVLLLGGHTEDERFVSSDLRKVYNSLKRDGFIKEGYFGQWDITDKGMELAEEFSVSII